MTNHFRDDETRQTHDHELHKSVAPATGGETLLSRYEVVAEVGRGGMGVVYQARHRHLNHQVAIKYCRPDADIERFRREAKLLASVRSPHVVPVHDFDVLPDGTAILVMSWVPGRDMSKIIRQHGSSLDSQRIVPWMVHVCQGMSAASREGIVHRDLKPANILIDERDSALVADFGLARPLSGEQMTLDGDFLGTPLYMAPEQAEDPRSADTRSDIYSFGATFYHALTGRPPFEGTSPFSILFKHKTEPLVSPSAINTALEPALSDCLERCLAKAPQDRFPSFESLLSQLESQASNAAWDVELDATAAHHLDRYRGRREFYLCQQHGASSLLDSYDIASGRTLSIISDDLTDQRVDAVVSCDDDMLSMSGGVAARISSVGGPAVSAMASVFTPVRPGRVIVTTGGKLPSRFVFHSITMGKWDDRWIRPSRDLLNEIMESCFYQADTLGLSSLALPLLATGTGRFSREMCLDTMFRFLVRKLVTGLTSVKEVRIVIFNRGRKWN